jgi:hypothetical protein
MSEKEVMARTQLELPRLGYRLLRNNIGAFQDARGKWIHFGVGGKGGSDLLGYKIVKVTPEMIGRKIAVFAAIEVKKDESSSLTPEQAQFLAAVGEAGGRAHTIYGERGLRAFIDAERS